MNKVAIVTGGSGTIGSEIAIKLSESDYDVIICYKTSEIRAIEVLETLNNSGNHDIVNVDLSSLKSVKNMFEFVYSKYQKINLLVNNAGYTKTITKDDINQLSITDVDNILNCNVKGVFYCSREFLNYIDSGEDFNIINIGSNSVYTLNASNSLYIASKMAVMSLTKSFAKDYGDKVRVNCVLPGLVKSKLTSDSDESRFDYVKDNTPLNRLCTSKDVADVVLAVINDMKFVNGQSISVDGGRTFNG